MHTWHRSAHLPLLALRIKLYKNRFYSYHVSFVCKWKYMTAFNSNILVLYTTKLQALCATSGAQVSRPGTPPVPSSRRLVAASQAGAQPLRRSFAQRVARCGRALLERGWDGRCVALLTSLPVLMCCRFTFVSNLTFSIRSFCEFPVEQRRCILLAERCSALMTELGGVDLYVLIKQMRLLVTTYVFHVCKTKNVQGS